MIVFRHLLLLLGALALLAPPVHAERIVFQRGDALYIRERDGRETRRLFAIGNPLDTLWVPSPDGRRIAWAVPLKAKSSGASLAARPMAIWIAELSGQRRKRLFSTDALRDRQGRRVTGLGVRPSGNPDSEGGGAFAEWALDSLCWSADGKSLYLSCTFLPTIGGRATFVIDAATGAAVVDAEGRWKSIAEMSQVDARGSLLVGVGLARAADGPEVRDSESKYAPLLVTNLAEGKTVSLLPAAFTSKNRPPYSIALSPVLSPDARTIAFSAIREGLWIVDVGGKNYRRLTARPSDDAPRWSSDGKRVLFLSVTANPGTARVATDLYEMPAIAAATGGDKRRLVIGNVDRFFVLPE